MNFRDGSEHRGTIVLCLSVAAAVIIGASPMRNSGSHPRDRSSGTRVARGPVRATQRDVLLRGSLLVAPLFVAGCPPPELTVVGSITASPDFVCLGQSVTIVESHDPAREGVVSRASDGVVLRTDLPTTGTVFSHTLVDSPIATTRYVLDVRRDGASVQSAATDWVTVVGSGGGGVVAAPRARG